MAAPMARERDEPSTPRAKKCRRLCRQWSDEKENMPEGRFACLEVQNLPAFKATGASSVRENEAYPLVGREDECGQLDAFLERSLASKPGHAKCMYVSGGPGTGKTCSARASIKNWTRKMPDTQTLEVNCMELTQRSVSGVFQRLLSKTSKGQVAARSVAGLAAATAVSLAQSASRVVVVVDEVDQLVSRGKKCSALSLETLFSLPQLPGAPPMAIIAIANAVDLLERTGVLASSLGCASLLFTPYSKDQLKSIVTSRIKAREGGEAALKKLGPIKLELRVRQAAKERGDCRQVLSLIEEGLFEANLANQEAERANIDVPAEASKAPSGDSPPGASALASCGKQAVEQAPKRTAFQPLGRSDPLQSVPHLPLEQKLLLFVLASSKHETIKISDLCFRYRELCRAQHQPESFASKSQVSTTLCGLEQRGLLEMRAPRASGRGRAKMQATVSEATVELSVACDVLRKQVVQALPALEYYMK